MSLSPPSKTEKHQERLLRHVVMFRWKDRTPEEKVSEIERAFCALPSKIAAIHSLEWGTDISVEGKSKEMSHCFLVTFASVEDRDAYLPDPDHESFVRLARPHVEDVLVLDYWQQT